MIDIICYKQNYYKLRVYRQKARKDYLNLAKCKKRTAKKNRKAKKVQLLYICRDLGYIDAFLEEIDLCDDFSKQLATIRTLVEQQQYMYDNKVDKKQEYIDNNDRIEVERAFSLAKHRYGLGLITAKLDTTIRSSIALSIIAMNVNRLTVVSFAQILVSLFSGYKLVHCTVKYMQNKSYKDLVIC